MRNTPRNLSIKSIFLAMALATAAAAPAFAQDGPPPPPSGEHCGGPDHHGHRGHKHGMMMHDLHQLDLSDAQKQAIHQAMKATRDNMKAQFQSLMQQRRAFESAVPGTPEFNTAYGSYSQAAASAAEARIKAEADLRTQIYGQLTDDQRAKLATLKAQHQQKWQSRASEG